MEGNRQKTSSQGDPSQKSETEQDVPVNSGGLEEIPKVLVPGILRGLIVRVYNGSTRLLLHNLLSSCPPLG